MVLLAPRMLALHLAAVAAMVACVLLAGWQWDRYRQETAPRAVPAERADAAPAPLATVSRPGVRMSPATAGRPVTASGTFDAAHQLLVPRRESGVQGFWVLTPLRVGDGVAVPVVRGWVPRADDPRTRVPAGAVTVTGPLLPPEPIPPPGRAHTAPPPGQVRSVSTAQLITVLPYPRLHEGYVLQERISPPVAGPERATAPPLTRPGGTGWQNLAYVVLWLIFAGFAGFMWLSIVRDRLRTARSERVAWQHR